MLSAKAVAAWYGDTQGLFDVSIDVRPGEVLALVGTNGAGKTTLVRAILGLIKTAGAIEVDGQRIDTWPTHRRVRDCGLAVVHESHNLFGELSVRENLAMGARQPGAHLLASVEDTFPVIRERLDSPIASLSGGQRQMVALAKAILAQPRFIVLDEPTLGLSPLFVDEVYEHISEMRSSDVGILLIEQNLHRAASVATQLQLISIGRSSPPIPATDDSEVHRLQELAFGITEA